MFFRFDRYAWHVISWLCSSYRQGQHAWRPVRADNQTRSSISSKQLIVARIQCCIQSVSWLPHFIGAPWSPCAGSRRQQTTAGVCKLLGVCHQALCTRSGRGVWNGRFQMSLINLRLKSKLTTNIPSTASRISSHPWSPISRPFILFTYWRFVWLAARY